MTSRGLEHLFTLLVRKGYSNFVQTLLVGPVIICKHLKPLPARWHQEWPLGSAQFLLNRRQQLGWMPLGRNLLDTATQHAATPLNGPPPKIKEMLISSQPRNLFLTFQRH